MVSSTVSFPRLESSSVEKPSPLFEINPPALSKTAECLNSAFAADPNAIHALIVNRVPCNQSLVDHPQIYVDMLTVVDSSMAQATLLGVLNGVLVANGLPRVATKWTTEADEQGRRKLLGFCDYPEDIQKQASESATETSCSICFNCDGTLASIVDVIGRCDTCRDKERQAEAEKFGKSIAARQAEATVIAINEASSNSRGIPTIEELWEIYSHLQLLRSEEASQVTFTAPNPDDNDLPNEVVGVKDQWTEWLEVDFRGETLLECLRKAVDARRAWYVEKEAKRLKLSPKT